MWSPLVASYEALALGELDDAAARGASPGTIANLRAVVALAVEEGDSDALYDVWQTARRLGPGGATVTTPEDAVEAGLASAKKAAGETADQLKTLVVVLLVVAVVVAVKR